MTASDPWVLERDERNDSGHRVYVAPSGSPKSYTAFALNARRFGSAEEASQNACGNEHPVRLLSIGE